MTEGRIRISDDVLFQELQGDSVLLNLKTGTYLGLDSVGTRIWHLIGEDGTLSAVLQRMLGEFDVTEARCREDLETFVRQLGEHGLIVIE